MVLQLDRMRQGLASIERPETLARQAYLTLRKSIRIGVLSPDTFYSEVQVADVLQISRTPVREALIELSREGIVEIVPQRGFRLREVSTSQMQEVFQLRSLIESYVVRRLAAEVTQQQVRSLKEILDRQAKVSHDPGAFLEIDEEFHLAMPQLLGLERTKELLMTLRGIMWLSGSLAISRPQRSRAVMAEHREVLERIAAHDENGAEKAVRQHIAQTAQAAAALKQSPPATASPGTPRRSRQR